MIVTAQRLCLWLRDLVEPPPAAPPSEWDLTARVWGNDYTVLEASDGGQVLRLAGWHPQAPRFQVGDTLILRNGTGTTRYLLEEIRHPGDPPDMWFGRASFFPREGA